MVTTAPVIHTLTEGRKKSGQAGRLHLPNTCVKIGVGGLVARKTALIDTLCKCLSERYDIAVSQW